MGEVVKFERRPVTVSSLEKIKQFDYAIVDVAMFNNWVFVALSNGDVMQSKNLKDWSKLKFEDK